MEWLTLSKNENQRESAYEVLYNNMDSKVLGKRCKRFREDLGLTQQDAADELGYTRSMISKFEKGKVNNLTIFMWYLDRGFKIYEN